MKIKLMIVGFAIIGLAIGTEFYNDFVNFSCFHLENNDPPSDVSACEGFNAIRVGTIIGVIVGIVTITFAGTKLSRPQEESYQVDKKSYQFESWHDKDWR